MAVHEVRFPEDISWGAVGGHMWSTSVVEYSTGKEQRNQNWTDSRLEWDVTHAVKSQAQLDILIDFFNARRGRTHTFRYKDFTDFKLTQEVLQNSVDSTLVGDGSTTVFNVIKRYELVSPLPAATDVNSYLRRIFKLRGGAGDPLDELTEVWRVDGTPVTPASVDRNNAQVTFSVAPGAAEVCDVTIEYEHPARFNVDKMAVSIEDFNAYSWGSIMIKGINPLIDP